MALDSRYRKTDNRLLGVTRVTTAVLLMIMFIVIILGVICRYVLGSPAFWTGELARYVMFYMVLIGSVTAIREDRHPALTFVIEKLPVRVREKWSLIIDGLVFFVLIVVFWQGCLMAAEEWIGKTAALRISFFWVYLALPIGALLMMVQIVAKNVLGSEVPGKKRRHDSESEED